MNKIISHIQVVFSSIKKRGLKQTLLFLAGEYWLDIRFHVNTRPHLLSRDSSIIGSHIANANPHYGSNWFLLKSVFHDLIRKNIVIPLNSHLLDFGCGAGRVLIAAKLFGIKKVTGVEFSNNLCRRAEENLRKIAIREFLNFDSGWEVIHADACSYIIPDDVTLIFLYNPFDASIINIVAQRILKFVNSVNHTVTIIYVNPVHDSIFEQLGFKKLGNSTNEVALYACA